MKLSRKLILAPVAAALAALTAGGVVMWLGQVQSRNLHQSAETSLEYLRTTAQVREQLGTLHEGVLRNIAIIESVDEGELKAFVKRSAEQTAGMQRTLDGIVDAAPPSDALRAGWKDLSGLFGTYQGQVKKALEMGAVDRNMGIASMHAADATDKKLSAGLDQLAKQLEQLQAEAESRFTAEQQRLLALASALGLLATLAVVAWAWRMQRSVGLELERASQATQRVAAGDLLLDVHSSRKDELGDLLRSLQGMASQLRQTVQTVKSSAASINGASAEIASGNFDLSQRTEQTASSLQQTASAMAQLTVTVRQSADAAAQANQLASSAASVAQRGGEVVAQVVTTMDEINSRSRKIGDIIATIDGIAFQTNILALNAAVEAARAGEQGRGFAVVAGEVRNLANRSAEAAREIKSLIAASVEKVESGSRLVKDAGSTMGEIVASVQRVNDIMSEISAASTEQRQGIERVNQAVGELDQMTQQNAALVEESAAAAESLKGQAATLDQVMAGFQVGDLRPAAAAAAPAVSDPTARALADRAIQQARATPSSRPATAMSSPAAAPSVPAAPSASSARASQAAAPATGASDDWETF